MGETLSSPDGWRSVGDAQANLARLWRVLARRHCGSIRSFCRASLQTMYDRGATNGNEPGRQQNPMNSSTVSMQQIGIRTTTDDDALLLEARRYLLWEWT